MKHRIQDIAADGVVSDDELPALDEIIDSLGELSMIISKIKLIRDRLR